MIHLSEMPKIGKPLTYRCQDVHVITNEWLSSFNREYWDARVDKCIQCGNTHFFKYGTGDAELDDAIAVWKIKLSVKGEV